MSNDNPVLVYGPWIIFFAVVANLIWWICEQL